MAENERAAMTGTTEREEAETSMNADDYEAVVRFDAPPDKVYDALTAVAGLAGWWAPVTGSGDEGGELRFVFSGAARAEDLTLAEDPLLIRVDTARRPSRVAWTVLACDFLPDWVGTTPTFEVTPRGVGSELRFRHRGLAPRLECFSSCSAGWDHHLASLRAYVETGRGTPFGSDAGGEAGQG